MTFGQGPVAGPSPMPAGPSLPGRLRKRPEFLAVAKGRRFHTERVTVQALPRANDPAAGLRVGFTVTKREGRSTERNRIRRRLRTAIGPAAGPFAGEAFDVVVIGRQAAISAPFPRLVDDLATALGRLVGPQTPRRAPSRHPRHV